MSIANENNRVEITATATQTTFTYDFKINDETEIEVFLTPDGNTPNDAADLLTLTTDYTVTGVGEDAGGTIVLTAGSYPTGAAADDTVIMLRAIPYTQGDEFTTGQDNAETLESSMDKMVMRLQRMAETLSRCFTNEKTGSPVTGISESTWTPKIQDASASDAEGQTYSVQHGTYIKIGKTVFITGRLVITSIGTISSAVRIAGLPFTSNTVTNQVSAVHFGNASSLSIGAGEVISGQIGNNGDYISLLKWDNTGGCTTLLATELTDGAGLTFSGQYTVD